jgi:chemotaxis protein MotB
MKRPHAAHENHERWLVSYADFITLLFAFFVVMFASSQGNKAAQVSAAVRSAMEEDKITTVVTTALGRGKHEANKKAVNVDPKVTQETQPPAQSKAPKADLQKSLQQLQAALAAELQSGKVQVWLDERGLTISLHEAAFFDSGEAAVLPSSLPTLDKIGRVVADVPNPIRLEGHTDDRPIHNSRYRNNWELSAARAISMLELLEDRYHMASERMSVTGYAENLPSDTNDTEEGRAHNRRVDLVVLSEQGAKSDPLPAAGK